MNPSKSLEHERTARAIVEKWIQFQNLDDLRGAIAIALAKETAQLEAERDALVTERDELKRESDIWEKSSLLSILNELKQAEQERDALVTALEPFANYARVYDMLNADDSNEKLIFYYSSPNGECRMTVGDIRRALAAVRVDPAQAKKE